MVGRPRDLRASPGARVHELSRKIGEAEVAEWCAGLLTGHIGYDDRRHPPLTWIGGAHAVALDRRLDSRERDYFPRVWAARALKYAWDPAAAAAVIAALADPAWRVREMSANVILVRGITDAQPVLERLVSDPVARVRAAAERALDALVGAAIGTRSTPHPSPLPRSGRGD